ncbi:MAG: GntR family transcriptional regulator [Synergistaceae bacterium]|nr:GntR family transcriptional regulator [Synergistaceae bacterium]
MEQTASGVAYTEIKRMIMLKRLTPGQRLAELSLSQEIGLSRTPVREALRRLASEGWLLMVPNSGVWVASPTRREIIDAYEVRARLEQWGVEAAVPNVTPLLLRRLEENIAEEEAVYAGKISPERYPDINRRFHMSVAEAGGSDSLCRHIMAAVNRTDIYMILYENYLDFSGNRSLSEHRALLELIRKRDTAKAVEMIKTHVENGFLDLKIDC